MASATSRTDDSGGSWATAENQLTNTTAALAAPPRTATPDPTLDAIASLVLNSPMKLHRAPPSEAVAGYSPELTKALKSVVKIFTTSANPNFSQPWQMHAQSTCTASGFVISPLGERRILTNAHAVANHVVVKVRKHGSAQKFNARVLAVGHECDIAMLTVDDDEFWRDVQPLEINGLPAMQESVMVVGFPQGGDNVCVTKGVVSRIDRQQYSHGRTALLAIQVDAAINSGNSGGPVLLGDRVVGIAFQCLTSGDNIGYIIPVPVINHFLEDLRRNSGKYTGFCELGLAWQCLENPDMKSALGMPKGMTGVYVTKTEPLFDAAHQLQPGDVLTHFDGVEIADDGTFLFREAVRIDFRHMVSQAFHGDMSQVKVWRDGKHMELSVTLSTPKQLVPVHSHDVKPDYFIYAGLVFTPLSCWYLKSQYGADWSCKAPIKLCERAFAGSMQKDGQQVVVLSKVLAADINTGYQDTGNIQVLRVNGTPVHNLAHLAQLVTACTAPFVRFELEWHKVVVIDHAKATKLTDEILRQNAIPAAYSKGLLDAPVYLGDDSKVCEDDVDDCYDQEVAVVAASRL
eukprot:jgi/Chrzof1/2994/Cz12g07110.t1